MLSVARSGRMKSVFPGAERVRHETARCRAEDCRTQRSGRRLLATGCAATTRAGQSRQQSDHAESSGENSTAQTNGRTVFQPEWQQDRRAQLLRRPGTRGDAGPVRDSLAGRLHLQSAAGCERAGPSRAGRVQLPGRLPREPARSARLAGTRAIGRNASGTAARNREWLAGADRPALSAGARRLRCAAANRQPAFRCGPPARIDRCDFPPSGPGNHRRWPGLCPHWRQDTPRPRRSRPAIPERKTGGTAVVAISGGSRAWRQQAPSERAADSRFRTEGPARRRRLARVEIAAIIVRHRRWKNQPRRRRRAVRQSG